MQPRRIPPSLLVVLTGLTYRGGIGALGFELIYFAGLSLLVIFAPRFWLVGKRVGLHLACRDDRCTLRQPQRRRGDGCCQHRFPSALLHDANGRGSASCCPA